MAKNYLLVSGMPLHPGLDGAPIDRPAFTVDIHLRLSTDNGVGILLEQPHSQCVTGLVTNVLRLRAGVQGVPARRQLDFERNTRL